MTAKKVNRIDRYVRYRDRTLVYSAYTASIRLKKILTTENVNKRSQDKVEY
jgi:hypothetical protein